MLAIAVQNGKVVMAGYSDQGGTTSFDFSVARFLADGTPDPSFNTTGFLTVDVGAGFGTGIIDGAFAIAIQNDGRIVLGGIVDGSAGNRDIALLVLNEDGTPDNNFGTNGIVTTDLGQINGNDNLTSLALQPNGDIVIGGYTDDAGNESFAVARYSGVDGSLDAGFGFGGITIIDAVATPGIEQATSIAIQPDGNIVLGGYAMNAPTGNDFVLMRFLGTDGSLDGSFGTAGIAITDLNGAGSNDRIGGIAVDGNGDIIAVGVMNTGSDDDVAVTKYVDGVLDGTFGTAGLTVTDITGGNDLGTGVAIQNDGKIVVSVQCDNDELTVARYDALGVLDPGFGTAGIATVDVDAGVTNDLTFAVKLTGFRIYVAGYISIALNTFDVAVAALLNDGAPLPLSLLSFTAQKQNSTIALNWKTEREEAITQFVIERSSDGRNFSAIGHVSPSKTNALVKSYSFVDKQPLPANNFYRLAIKEVDETFSYSKVLAIKFNKQGTKDLEIFTNPVANNSLRMQLPDGLAGRVNMRIVDATGRVVKTQVLELIGGSSIATTMDVSNLQKGVYFINITSSNNITITKKFVKN